MNVTTPETPSGDGGKVQVPWGRKILLVAGILLVGLTLRSAVTAVSPVVSDIDQDLHFDSVVLGLLGTLPALVFAVFGFLTPYVLRWASLERLMVLAMLFAAAGQVLRAIAPNSTLFLVFSAMALGGLGAGNVLLPPLVKQYFPQKIGLMTALYVTMLGIGTAAPPQLAVPLAHSFSWQLSLGSWALVATLAAGTWAVILLGAKQAEGSAAASGTRKQSFSLRRFSPWRSPMAWGLAAMFGMGSFNSYSMFAWLPQVLQDSGASQSDAGSLLAIYAALGIPTSLTIPLLASRMRNQFPLMVGFLICFIVGYAGLMFIPDQATWVWVMIAGIGTAGTFPLSLVLINLRTKTQEGAGALSGFSQGMGYLLAAGGPLGFGLLYQFTGAWNSSFLLLFFSLVVLALGSYIACRPGYLEE